MTQREKTVMQTSVIGIFINLLLGVLKAIIGTLSGSIAMVSDALNNITDSSSSVITIIGTKLAGKKADKEHPFGHGRAEYLTSLIIGTIVLVTGGETFLSSVKEMLHPTEVLYGMPMISMIIITIVVKIILGIYTEKQGEKAKSGALVVSGKDAKNDALVSVVTLISVGIYFFLHINVDGTAGAIISCFVIKTGIDVIRETLTKILGEREEGSLAKKIVEIVEGPKEILGSHDLILHNYGPDTYIGSINVDVDYRKRVGELYPLFHRLQTDVYQQLKVILVFGICGLNESSPTYVGVREVLNHFLEIQPHCLGFHGIVVDEERNQIFCDITLDFECDQEAVKQEAMDLLREKYPEKEILIIVDVEFTGKGE